ncbi:d0a73d59-aaf0-4045-835d-1e8292a975ad-CDS [Sclerotinia trifoliorum]|uniref:D0a73d59-aaf0-4045-835d-1e8292a975ad-CDS n=1 Tax=Sclerotinia trifoliorum TaxID=28548 RepID=A0A8H2W6E1_9HELO|nr:d0a73d59-aaf0-4045-835d-1e8292a975ad-CDS [Sclerotinia trifoliorum]
MSGTEARFCVSWKHNEFEYYTQKVDSFLLQEPENYIKFRKYIRNIIDWGKEKRLDEIRNSLDSLLEERENSLPASQPAKSCPLP